MRAVILISGRGSNMQAIVEQQQAGRLPIDIRAIVSNRPDAAGLDYARQHGLHAECVDHRQYPQRSDFDDALQRCIDGFQPELVILAGFMRILGDPLVAHYRARMLNIHPSLLPKYPGLDTHARALQAGDREHGASVHFVTEELDGGPLIAQAVVPIETRDNAEQLAQRVLEQEHKLYPLVIRWFAERRLSLETRDNTHHKARLDQQDLEHPIRMTAQQLSEQAHPC